MIVIHGELKSQPCKTIHHTYNETLKGLRCCEWPQSVQTHAILAWKVERGKANFDPTRDWKTRCGDHFWAHAPIATFSNHSLYIWWEVGRVEMLWNSWINPKYSILVWNVGGPGAEIVTPCDSELRSQGVMILIRDEFKSKPCTFLHYTYCERLEGLGCCELPESVQSHSILVWNVEAFLPDCHHPLLKSRGVAMVLHDGFKSQPCTTINTPQLLSCSRGRQIWLCGPLRFTPRWSMFVLIQAIHSISTLPMSYCKYN